MGLTRGGQGVKCPTFFPFPQDLRAKAFPSPHLFVCSSLIPWGISPCKMTLNEQPLRTRWIGLLIAFGVALSSLSAHAHNLAVQDVPLTERDFETPFDWDGFADKPLLIEQATTLSETLYARSQALLQEMGEAAFIKLVDKDGVKETFPGWRGELTNIDKKPVARLVHAETGLSFFVLDKDTIGPASKHLRKVIARQHIDAGDKREDGSRLGRDTVFVWRRGDEVEKADYYPRHPPFSREWAKDYIVATYEKPDAPAVAFGLFCGLAQADCAGFVEAMHFYNTPGSDFSYGMIAMSALWGTGIGVYNATYRSFIYRGSEKSKFRKLWGQSMLFAWSLAVFTQGAWTLVNFTAPAFLQIHGNAFVNSWLHNQGRRAWYLFPEARNHNRLNTQTLKFGTHDTGIKQSSAEQQMLYLVPYSLKSAGLIGIGTLATLPLMNGVEWKFDAGTALLIASIPVAQMAAVSYARAKGFPQAEDYAKEFKHYWKRMLTLPISQPIAAARWATRQVHKGFVRAKSCAAELLVDGPLSD